MADGYTDEQRAAAWASYYAQQGYDAAAIAMSTGIQHYDPSTGHYSAYIPPAEAAGGYQPQASSSASAAASASGSGSGMQIQFSSSAASLAAPPPSIANRPVFDADLLNQSSVYEPGATHELAKQGKYRAPPGKRETVVRKGSGRTWEDPTLTDWDPIGWLDFEWYRLFVGDVSNDVNERTLNEAFGKYPTYCKCKVVKDRLSLKSKYAFIAFKDPEDFLKAWKEMDGKYVGNRPIRLIKVKEDRYGGIATTEVSGKKARELDKLRRNRGKPLDGRPVPY